VRDGQQRVSMHGVARKTAQGTRIMGIRRINGASSAESTALASRSCETADQRRARGRAIRDAVPRESRGGWKAPNGRSDPIRILQASNEGRIPSLIPVRFGRMAQSAFAFYRGAAAIMAADLSMTPVSALQVQACGDAHLMNFGAFATPERHVIFDINDLDETLPAPWEWDLKRLLSTNTDSIGGPRASSRRSVHDESRIATGDSDDLEALGCHAVDGPVCHDSRDRIDRGTAMDQTSGGARGPVSRAGRKTDDRRRGLVRSAPSSSDLGVGNLL
jgi:hypothetical protein